MQLGHIEVSPTFRQRAHRCPCFFLACWSLAISEMKCSPHSLHVHGLTTGWPLTRDSSHLLSNVLSPKCKPPTRARHLVLSSATSSQLFSHPGSSGDSKDCLATGDRDHSALMSARICWAQGWSGVSRIAHNVGKQYLSLTHPAQVLESGFDQQAFDGWCTQSSPHLAVGDGRGCLIRSPSRTRDSSQCAHIQSVKQNGVFVLQRPHMCFEEEP